VRESLFVAELPYEGEKVARDLNGKGLDCHFVGLDVDSEPQVIKVVDAIVAEFGTIDILVNDAGVARHSDTPDVDVATM
jgi:NAD(P)-dependent dehydrogenase (short-subunit alcohol dehydrogenase family)